MSKGAQSHIEFCVEKHMLCTCGSKTHTVENPACAATYRRLAVAACMEATESIRDHATALQISDNLLRYANIGQKAAQDGQVAVEAELESVRANYSDLEDAIWRLAKCAKKTKKSCGKCGCCKLRKLVA